jgi:hypothetical protein
MPPSGNSVLVLVTGRNELQSTPHSSIARLERMSDDKPFKRSALAAVAGGCNASNVDSVALSFASHQTLPIGQPSTTLDLLSGPSPSGIENLSKVPVLQPHVPDLLTGDDLPQQSPTQTALAPARDTQSIDGLR